MCIPLYKDLKLLDDPGKFTYAIAMKFKQQLLICLFLVSVTSVFSQTSFFKLKDDIIRDLKIMQSIYPRNEGSSQEKDLFTLLEKRLGEMSLAYTSHDFQRSEHHHSFSRFIDVTIPGEIKDTVIICVPVNNPPQSTNRTDGSVNIALALGFLTYLRESRPPVTVKVLFLGAEYGREDYYPMSSRLFLNSFFPEYNVLVVYLNFEKVPGKVIIKCGANGIVAPYWLINKCSEALKTANVPFLVKGNQNQAFRTGLSDERAIISPYLHAGYPAISLEGEYVPLSTTQISDWLLSINFFLQDFLTSCKEGIPGKQEWDYHYLFFQFFDISFILSEKILIIIIIVIITLMLAYAFVRSGKLKKYILTLKNNLWNIPVFFGLVFIILVISTLMLDLLTVIRGFPELWTFLPAVFFITKMILCLLFSTLFYMALKKYGFSKNGSFYTTAALLFLILTVFIIALINISFTYYFLWALFFIFLFSISRRRVVKIILLLVSQLWIVIAVVDFFRLPELQICKAFIFSPIIGNLLFTIVVIPFILLLIRIRFLFRYAKRRYVRSVSMILGINLLVVVIILIGYIILFNPFNSDNPQPVTAERQVDFDKRINRLILSSDAPLGKFEVSYDRREFSIDTRARNVDIPLTRYPELFSYNLESVGFLNRKNITVVLMSQGDPFKIEVKITAESEFVLYDANFPYSRQRSGSEYTVYIGKNPPNPLKLELTLPKERRFHLGLTFYYDTPPLDVSVSGKDVRVNSELLLNKSIDINT
jgi:hypothetical protein